jgi:hypothetical protein
VLVNAGNPPTGTAKEATALMKYWVKIPVHVAQYQGDLGDNIDEVVQELVKLQGCSGELLDFSADSDATDDTAAFAVTVEADSLESALQVGTAFIRAAIHATGAATPDWDEVSAYENVVIYQLDLDESVQVRQLVTA